MRNLQQPSGMPVHKWLIPIEGVVAVWKSPALSSGLAIVDEVSEPTRGSHRGVRVIR